MKSYIWKNKNGTVEQAEVFECEHCDKLVAVNTLEITTTQPLEELASALQLTISKTKIEEGDTTNAGDCVCMECFTKNNEGA